ncbi:MAG: hypothetical protein ACM3IJ_04975 [Candidatus Levyibacteriota bacterium]
MATEVNIDKKDTPAQEAVATQTEAEAPQATAQETVQTPQVVPTTLESAEGAPAEVEAAEPTAELSGEQVEPEIHPEVSEAGVQAVGEATHGGMEDVPSDILQFRRKPESEILHFPTEFKKEPVENSGRWKKVTEWLHGLKRQFLAGKTQLPDNVTDIRDYQNPPQRKAT